VQFGMGEFVNELIDAIRSAGEFDCISAFTFEMPITFICGMLGVPKQNRAQFREWTVALAQTLEPLPPPEIQDAADDATIKMTDYLRGLIAERRQDPGDDLLGGLIAAEEQGQRLTEDEVISTAGLVLGAGFETTTNLLGNGLLALLRHPDQWQLLQSDIGLAPAAVEELLRYDSPVQMATPRVANEPIEAGGHTIAPGEVVVNVVAAANRDPARHTDPDVVDLRRAEPDPLSFGGGPHYCLGASLARLEGAVAFTALATKLPDIQLQDEQPRWRRALNLRGLEALQVTVS